MCLAHELIVQQEPGFKWKNEIQTSKYKEDANLIISNDAKIPEFTGSLLKNAANNPKLSYTPFQLELLNMIYSKWKHPKAEQKTFIAKVVGITRKQTLV